MSRSFRVPYRLLLVQVCFVVLSSAQVDSAGAQAIHPARVTLDEALAIAFAQNPTLLASRAVVEEARGRLLTAKVFPFNPVLEMAVADRRGPEGSTTDYEIGLFQEIELGGQRGKRESVTESEFAAAEAMFVRQGRLLAAQVENDFAVAVQARELLVIAQTDAKLARDFVDLEQRRLEAGAATLIEVNLARAASGQAERQLQLATAADGVAGVLLAETLGMGPGSPADPVGELPSADHMSPPLNELLVAALANRADLEAFRQQRLANESRVRLAKSMAVPNLVIGAFSAQEEGTDDILGGAVAIGLPLFNRNKGGIEEARAALERVSHENVAFRLRVETEVAAALVSFRAAQTAAGQLRELVVGNLEENLELVQRSFSAGRISATDVLVFRREFVASQREYVEALTEAWQARIILDLATGRLSTPSPQPTGSTRGD